MGQLQITRAVTVSRTVTKCEAAVSKCKAKPKNAAATPAAKAGTLPAVKLDANALVPGPKLRQLLGISPVTPWRWRHDESMGFPAAKSIQGRLYFPWHAVSAWLEGRPSCR
jgi:hypothetical protein